MTALILMAVATAVAGIAAIMSLLKVFKRNRSLGRKKRIMQAATLTVVLLVAAIVSYPLWTKDERDDLPADTKFSTGYIVACVSTGLSAMVWAFLVFRVCV